MNIKDLQINDIIQNTLNDATFVVQSIGGNKYVILANNLSPLDKKEVTDLTHYKKFSRIESVDGRYRKFSVGIQDLQTPKEILETKEWEDETYETLLDLIQKKEWDLVRENIDQLKSQHSSHEFHHNLNPLAIFADLFKRIGRKAMEIVKEYEKEIWGLHKDSVYTQDFYDQDRNKAGEPFEMQPIKGPYPEGYVPINKPAKKTKEIKGKSKEIPNTIITSDTVPGDPSITFNDLLEQLKSVLLGKTAGEVGIEMENADPGHGTLAPADMISMDPSNRVKVKKKYRGPQRVTNPSNVEYIDKLDTPGSYTMDTLFRHDDLGSYF